MVKFHPQLPEAGAHLGAASPCGEVRSATNYSVYTLASRSVPHSHLRYGNLLLERIIGGAVRARSSRSRLCMEKPEGDAGHCFLTTSRTITAVGVTSSAGRESDKRRHRAAGFRRRVPNFCDGDDSPPCRTEAADQCRDRLITPDVGRVGPHDEPSFEQRSRGGEKTTQPTCARQKSERRSLRVNRRKQGRTISSFVLL